MRIALWSAILVIPVMASCGDATKPSANVPAEKAASPKPPDESYRFPKDNLVTTKVVDVALMGKPFMPGGTVAHYKKGKVEYEMFVAELATATDAAILLPDWRRALTEAKLVPSFGGYFGMDGGHPVFVFTKNTWIAGVAGLPQKEADREARILAGQIN